MVLENPLLFLFLEELLQFVVGLHVKLLFLLLLVPLALRLLELAQSQLEVLLDLFFVLKDALLLL